MSELITVNHKFIIDLESDPSTGGGYVADPGSIGMWNDGGVGQLYLKVGASNTAWEPLDSGSLINAGTANRLALYTDTYELDDQTSFGGYTLDVAVASHTLTANRSYTIPDVGLNASFVMTEGAQTIAGDKTFDDDVIIQGDLTVNGALTYVNTTNLEVTDKMVTLNKGGAADSGGGAGIEIEENGIITSYIKTENSATSDAFRFKAPDSEQFTLNLEDLTAARQVTAQDRDGYLALQTNDTLTTGSVVFIDANNRLHEDNSNFFWDDSNDRLGIATNSPQDKLHVAGNSRISGSGSLFRHYSESLYVEGQFAQVTTDATPTALGLISTSNNTAGYIKVFVVGRKTAGAGASAVGSCSVYERSARYENIGGTLTIYNLQTDFTGEAVAGHNAQIVSSGTNIEIRVLGSTNNTLTWETHYKLLTVD